MNENKQLFGKLGECGADNLVAGTVPPLMTFLVDMRENVGNLKRGAVLAVSSVDEKMVPIGMTVAEGETLTANCVLADDIDTSAETTASAYRSGHFIRNTVEEKSDHTLTFGEEDALRMRNILLTDAI